MRKLIFLLPLLLTACVTAVPVGRNFPNVPDELKQSCPDLAMVDTNTTKLSDVIGTVSSNYSQYHECRERVDAWIEWYSKQKDIFESVK
jgi:hypothetical protein